MADESTTFAAVKSLVRAFAAERRDWLARFCTLPRIVYWGRVSYSLYITHFLALAIFRLVFNLAGSDPLRLAAATLLQIGLIIVLAVGSYHLVEEPGRVWLLGVLKRLTLKAPLVRNRVKL